jgi:Na+/glutamate symporter
MTTNSIKVITGQHTGEVEKLNKKLDKLKNTHVIEAQNKGHAKKIASVEAQLKALSQQMTFSSFKSHMIVGLLMIAVINVIGTYFSGQVVAMLPFEPFSLMRGITHRNIQG